MIKFNLLSLSQMGRDHFIQHSVVLRVDVSSPLNRTGALLVFVMTSVFAGCGRDPSISLVELVEMDRALIEIAGDTRQAITPAFPAELSFDVDVPNNPTLKFSIALTTAKRAERARVDFRVRVVSEDVSVTVFRRTLRVDEHNQWHDASVNLAAWAGKAASLHFETFPARGKLDVPVWADRVTTVWGAPELVPDAPVTPVRDPDRRRHPPSRLPRYPRIRRRYLDEPRLAGARIGALRQRLRARAVGRSRRWPRF